MLMVNPKNVIENATTIQKSDTLKNGTIRKERCAKLEKQLGVSPMKIAKATQSASKNTPTTSWTENHSATTTKETTVVDATAEKNQRTTSVNSVLMSPQL